MELRYQKRIKLGKGLGLNISKSGISSSFRTKKGTIGTKGFSVRTGISGLTYRKTFSKSSKSGCLSFVLILVSTVFTLFIILK